MIPWPPNPTHFSWKESGNAWRIADNGVVIWSFRVQSRPTFLAVDGHILQERKPVADTDGHSFQKVRIETGVVRRLILWIGIGDEEAAPTFPPHEDPGIDIDAHRDGRGESRDRFRAGQIPPDRQDRNCRVKERGHACRVSSPGVDEPPGSNGVIRQAQHERVLAAALESTKLRPEEKGRAKIPGLPPEDPDDAMRVNKAVTPAKGAGTQTVRSQKRRMLQDVTREKPFGLESQ